MFSLSRMIRDAIEVQGLADPQEIAAHVGPQIPTEQRDRLFSRWLTMYARLYIGRRRRTVLRSSTIIKVASAVLPVKSSEKREEERQRNRAINDRAIARRRAEKMTWMKKLESYPVSPAKDVWKMLADCSLNEVIQLGEQQRWQEAASGAKAARFERLAERMQELGVTEVRDAGEGAAQEFLT